MFLELHILQNFAPSNLNRDDTGSPKSADFGGYRRARISSQSIKRAIRQEFDAQALVPAEHRATRTKRLLASVHSTLVEMGRDAEPARQVVSAALGALEIRVADVKEDDREDLGNYKTQYLLYLGAPEIDRIASFCHDNWDALVTAVEAGSARSAKKDVRRVVEDAVGKAEVAALKESLDGGKAADLALFGRMLADIPERNIDAASQVAHAISTHRVGVEFDYYTAVDDLKPDDTAGADMIGTIEFNSACYYRYANVEHRPRIFGCEPRCDTDRETELLCRTEPSILLLRVRSRRNLLVSRQLLRGSSPRGEWAEHRRHVGEGTRPSLG